MSATLIESNPASGRSRATLVERMLKYGFFSRLALAATLTFLMTSSAFSGQASVNSPIPPPTMFPGPCRFIELSCIGSGFTKGDWTPGQRLWKDCENPISQGIAKVPGATRSLPLIDPKILAACKAQHPKFGMGSVGK